jgi:nuclear pore complex protein Nup107
MLDIHVDSTAANDILQAYIVILQTEGNEQLVAQYAAEMESGSAEYSYAAFLRGMLVSLGGTAVWRGS